MKSIFGILIGLAAWITCNAQQPVFRFDFGPGRVMKGYTPVTASTRYSNETGYGFDKYSLSLEAILMPEPVIRSLPII